MLRALAHPARRAFVRACADRQRTVGDLLALTDLMPPSVSEHLRVLRKTGLLVLERDGRHRRYRTDATVVQAAAASLSSLGA